MCQSDLRAVFRIMIENPSSWDNDTLMMAAGYDRWLSKASTCFLMMAYEGIFCETECCKTKSWTLDFVVRKSTTPLELLNA